jgi:uncharacterized protein
MKAVIDTNVIISAILKDSSIPAAALRYAHQDHVILKSEATEHEVRRILATKKLSSYFDTPAKLLIDAIFSAAEAVSITEIVEACRDPADNMFLELAINGNADLIISGDGDLCSLITFRDIPILRPADFIKLYYS